MNPHRQTIDNPTGDTHIDRLRGVPTDGDMNGLLARNLERARAFAKSMGQRWTLHPSNRPAKQGFTLQEQR